MAVRPRSPPGHRALQNRLVVATQRWRLRCGDVVGERLNLLDRKHSKAHTVTCGGQNPEPREYRTTSLIVSAAGSSHRHALNFVDSAQRVRTLSKRTSLNQLKLWASTNDFYSKFDCIVEGCEVDVAPTAHWHAVSATNSISIRCLNVAAASMAATR